MNDYCPFDEAQRDLNVPYRRLFELAAQGVIGIVVVGTRVGLSKADVTALSAVPEEGAL